MFFNARPTPDFFHDNPIDLDVWLEQKDVHIEKKRYSNRDAIHAFASTIAVHFDVDKHPLVDTFTKMRTTITESALSVDVISNYMCNVALLAAVLGQELYKTRIRLRQ